MGDVTTLFEVRLNSVLFNRVGYTNVIMFPALAYQWSKRKTTTRFPCIPEPLLALLQMYDGFVWSNVFNNSDPFNSSKSVCFFRFGWNHYSTLQLLSPAYRGAIWSSSPGSIQLSISQLIAYRDHVLPVMALVLLPTTTATQPVQSPPQLLVLIMVFIPIYMARHTRTSCECNSPC